MTLRTAALAGIAIALIIAACGGGGDVGEPRVPSTLTLDERKESYPSSSVPVGVPGLEEHVTDIAAGFEHTCALMTSGKVRCWGRNDDGQLGDGTVTGKPTRASPEPRDVVELDVGVTRVVAGWHHTCALTERGVVKCWGSNVFGQLGDGGGEMEDGPVLRIGPFSSPLGVSPIPVEVVGLEGSATAITSGLNHVCVLTTGGGVGCWGDNVAGQLGAQSTERCGVNIPCNTTPVDVSDLTSGASAISAGFLHTCAVISGGEVKCWGHNAEGQLGDKTRTRRDVPVDVCSDFACTGPLSGVVALAAGGTHTCALTSVGGLVCWGDNAKGQLGAHPEEGCGRCNFAVPVSGLERGVTQVVTGNVHTCALTNEGGVKCWGSNIVGQLGSAASGTCAESSPCSVVPNDVEGLRSGVTAIAAGADHTCAVTSVGDVKCWGGNFVGQLGVAPAD